MSEFDEYIRQGEPGRKEKADKVSARTEELLFQSAKMAL